MDAPVNGPEKAAVEDKKMTTLRNRNTALQTSLHAVQAQRLALLYRMSNVLPANQTNITSESAYTPSMSSHSSPSNIPTLNPLVDEALMDEAKAIIKQHIKALHDYNEIKDVAQGLLGMVADTRGVRVRDLYKDEEFGISEVDGND